MKNDKKTKESEHEVRPGKKAVAAVSLTIFVLSLVPLLYMCRYVHASGDDYGYGAWTHAAWLDTHSLIEVFKAAGRTVQHYYIGWQGTWSSIFLFTLQPEVFSPDAYWIVPILMMGLTVISVSLLGHYLLVKKLGFSGSVFVIIDSCLLFTLLQFVPRTKSAIFWYNGTAHYIIPLFFALLAVYSFWRFIDSYQKRFWILALICMFMLGGASYLAALLAPVILVYLLIFYGKKRPKAFWLLIPLAVEAAGLVISMAAPGNEVRGGEELAFTFGKAFGTILESFRQGFFTMGSYFTERPVIYIVLLFIGIVVWEALLRGEADREYRLPGVLAVLLFCVYCAMFAPGIYAGTEVSGGVPNTIFQVFILTTAASEIYFLGWLHRWLDGKYAVAQKLPFWLEEKAFRLRGTIPLLVLCAVLVVICRSAVRNSTCFQCIEYVVSGQADDYKEQMDERLAILLDETRKEVELPQINQDQGPLMHMEVMEDPDAWTNQVACQFFRKDRIIEVERKQ